MKKLLLTLAAVAVIGGCKSTEDAYKGSAALTYPAEPSCSDVLLPLNSPLIFNSFKCFACNSGVTDNFSPKGDQGYYCYNVIGQSGTMVFDGKQFIGLEKFDEIMRKYDDLSPYITE